jgi:hypothetical protein
MRASFILCLLFLSSSILIAQTYFSYDPSGHRINRTIHLSSPSQAPSQVPPSDENDENDDKDEDDLALNDDASDFPMPGDSEAPDNNPFSEKVYTDKLKESDVLIYPNPTRGMLAVEIRNKNPQVSHQLTVNSLRGAVIFQKNHIGDYTTIDLSAQPKGVYLLRISSQDSFVTWKIVKE